LFNQPAAWGASWRSGAMEVTARLIWVHHGIAGIGLKFKVQNSKFKVGSSKFNLQSSNFEL
jgi:hypothetical protein